MIDVETNGFKHNEPLQIAAVLYEGGEEVDHLNLYIKGQQPSTEEALAVHGLTKKCLREKKAKKWSKKMAK